MKNADNKIIFLVAPPRSLSTAFLRMMQARGDFKVFNEPASSLFNKRHYPHSAVFYIKQTPQAYIEIKEKLHEALRHGNVFVKEMSFAFAEFIRNEPDFLANENVYFLFLLRNPHHCIISYYHKIPSDYLNAMLPHLADLTAYKSLHESYTTIQTHAINPAYVIHAERLIDDTANTVHALCEKIKITFMPESLHWNSLGNHFNGHQSWQEHKKSESTHHWHREAILSRGFHPPTDYALDENLNPAFTEIAPEEHKKICREVYRDYLAHYHSIITDQANLDR